MLKLIFAKFQSVKKFFSKKKKQVKKLKKAASKKILRTFKPFWKKFENNFPRAAKNLAKILKSKLFWKNFNLLFGLFALFVAGSFGAEFVFIKQFETVEKATTFMLERPEITAYSSFITLILIFFFFGFVGNTTWTIGLFYSFLTIVMFINDEKLASRNTPFLPEDLAMASEANSLGDMVNWEKLFATAWSIVAILLVCFIIDKILRKIPHYKFQKRYKILAQILIVAASWTNLMYHTDFLRTQISGRETTVRVDWLDSTIDFTNPKHNYMANGYIVSTISAFQANVITPPEDYSKEAVSKIIEKYSKLAEAENSAKKSIKDEKINIVYIMSESFVDPEKIKAVYDYGAIDPIPFTHSLMKKYSSGETSVAEYGGGTANVEFEALTGLSNYFLNAIPYTSILPQNSSTPSIARSLAQNGYQTTAIHPYRGTMYKRDVVYPNLGFDKFIEEDSGAANEKIDKAYFTSDQAAFDQVFETLQNSEKPDFVHLVTMQNHMPYNEGVYNSKNFLVQNISGDANEAKAWETYLEGLNKSDQALKSFIEKVQNFEEKTIVVFWGDHWPGIGNALLSSPETAKTTQNTPLFIYSNFENNKNNLEKISLNYLQTKVFELASIKLSPFQQLLLETWKQNPELTKKIEAQKSQTLTDYEIIEYDILAGKKYSMGKFFEMK